MTQTNDPPLISSIELIPDAAEKADLDAANTSGGKLVIGQAPNITITETAVVADADERLSLDVQEGDIAIQTNVSTSFIFTGGDNVANNWEVIDFDAVGAIDGEDITPRDITPRNITASGDISLQDLTVSGAINGADTSAAAAGEALTSDGSGSFSFASVGGGQILRNGSAIDYVALDISNLPASTGSNEVALLTASNEYVEDLPPLTTPFDITTQDFQTSIDSEDGSPKAIAWNDDGSRLYECGVGGDKIYQYDLSTPFDITSASFSTSIDSEGPNPSGIAWNDDGSRLYYTDFLDDKIYQYSVSTSYDISSASLSTSINTQAGGVQDIKWNNDGSRLYTVDSNSDKIYQYSVSTSYDISSASLSTSINTQNSSPEGIAWNDDGSRLYEVGRGSDKKIYQYSVSTPYDIDTASFSTDIPTEDSQPTGIAWNNDGSQLYEVGLGSDKIYQYTTFAGGWEAL